MNLAEAVARLDELGDDDVLCVTRPWSGVSEARICALDENLAVPEEVRDDGFDYFLDVPVAKEVLGVFGDKPPTPDEKVRLLLHYAEHDAYPGWVYER